MHLREQPACREPLTRRIQGGHVLSASSIGKQVLRAVLNGGLVLAPIYLAILLLLKAMGSLMKLMRPVAKLLPLPSGVPSGEILALLSILCAFFLVGLALQTRSGQKAKKAIEVKVLQNIPGYTSIRDLTQRVLGQSQDSAWKPALVEIEEALVPAFIIEELKDGRFTVFVPSIPTPLAGTVYILDRIRVHPVNIAFGRAVKVISQWGAGAKDLVAAIESPESVRLPEYSDTP